MGSISWTRKAARAHGSPPWPGLLPCPVWIPGPWQAQAPPGFCKVCPSPLLLTQLKIPKAFCFLPMSSIPYWCQDLPAAPVELGMGSRIPQSICDATPGFCVSHGAATLGALSQTPQGQGSVLDTHGSGMGFGFTPLTPNISPPPSENGGEFGTLVPVL